MAYTGRGGGGGAAGGAGRNADMYSRTDSESAPRPIDLRVFATFVNKILPTPLIDEDLFFPKKTLPSVDFLGDLRRSNDPGHGGVEINGTFYPMGTGTSYMTGESIDATSLEGDFTHFLTTTGLTAVLSPIMPVIYGHYDQTVYGNCLYFFLKSFTLEKDKTQRKFLSPSDEGSIDRTILSQEGGIFYLKFHSQISKISLLGTHGRDNLELNLTVMVKLQVIPLEAADVAAATVDAATSDNTGGGGAGRDRRSNAQAMEAMATAHDDLIKEESGKLKLHEVTLSGPDTGAFNALIEEIISHEALCNALKQRQAFIDALPNLAGARPLNNDQKRKLLLATPLNLFADYTQTSDFTSLLTALHEVYGEDTVNTTLFIGILITSIGGYATNATVREQMLKYFTNFRTLLQQSVQTAKERLLTPGEETPDLRLFETPAVLEAKAPAMVAGAETVDLLQVFIDAFPPHYDEHPLTPEEKTALQATIPLHLFDPDSTILVDLTAMGLNTVLLSIYEDTPEEKQSEMLLAWIRCIKKHARNLHVDYTPFRDAYIAMADGNPADVAMATATVDAIISGGIEDGEAAAPVPQPATVYGGATESKGPDYALEVAHAASHHSGTGAVGAMAAAPGILLTTKRSQSNSDATTTTVATPNLASSMASMVSTAPTGREATGRDRSLATAADAVAAALDAGDLEAMAAAVDDLAAEATAVGKKQGPMIQLINANIVWDPEIQELLYSVNPAEEITALKQDLLSYSKGPLHDPLKRNLINQVLIEVLDKEDPDQDFTAKWQSFLTKYSILIENARSTPSKMQTFNLLLQQIDMVIARLSTLHDALAEAKLPIIPGYTVHSFVLPPSTRKLFAPPARTAGAATDSPATPPRRGIFAGIFHSTSPTRSPPPATEPDPWTGLI